MDEENEDVKDLKQALAAVPKELLAEALSEQFESQEDSTPSTAQATIRAVTHSRAESFSGPLPPPEILRQYDDAHPGLADRVVSMAEREQAHRHGVEREALGGSINAERRGQNYALAICTLVVAASFGLIWQDHEVSGSILAGGTLSLP